jgi:DNA-binding NtrC family response regulator
MQTLPRMPATTPVLVPVAGVPDATGATTTSRAEPGVTITTLNVAEVERTLIARALEVAGGNRTRASELLGISVRTLRNKLNSPSESAEDDQAN